MVAVPILEEGLVELRHRGGGKGGREDDAGAEVEFDDGAGLVGGGVEAVVRAGGEAVLSGTGGEGMGLAVDFDSQATGFDIKVSGVFCVVC